MLNTSRCTHGSCTFDNVYQPQLHGDFVVSIIFIYHAVYNTSSFVNDPGHTIKLQLPCL